MVNIHKPTDRVISVLELLALSNSGYTLTEVSDKTKIPKSTLHPIMQTLSHHRFIAQDLDSKRYVIGMELFKLGNKFRDNVEILPIIKKHMNMIVNICDEICHLGVLDKGYVLYIEKIDPIQAIRLESAIGTTLPAYATALGKSLLIEYSKEEIKDLYKDGMEPITSKTIVEIDKLYSEIEKTRVTNVSHEVGESNEQVECLAVPLFNKGRVFASLSVSLPIYRSTNKKIEQIREQLLLSKNKIEKELSGIKVNTSMFFS